MAGSFFALLDDIASVLDDVAAMTKIAAKKTAGVLGDDLALNAQQVSGIHANREIPVVMAVAKGSLLNKAILIPAALAISAVAPWAIAPLLMIGGLYLCYEGAEKIAHSLLHRKEADLREQEVAAAFENPDVDMVQFEREKIKGAIRTDFILSAEIIVIALGTAAAMPFLSQVGVLLAIGLTMTFGVYGAVAGIVKIDDLGLHLLASASAAKRRIGRFLVEQFAPKLMKMLSVVGTAAMFTVGGGILAHGLHLESASESLAQGISPLFASLIGISVDVAVGLLAGALALAAHAAFSKILSKIRGAKNPG